MATAPKGKSTEIATWDEELAKYAQEAAKQEAATGGAFFSIKSGVLSFNDAPIPGNEMAVIIADSVLENVFYGTDYDPDVISPPSCYAFGRDESTMAPFQTVIDDGTAVSDKCYGCPMNQFGSADKGKGKACGNRRRLALIPAGKLANGKFTAFTKPEDIEKAEMGLLKIPPTSVKGYGAYVKQLAGALQRPPFAVFTKIKLVPDAKSQFAVTFELLGPVPGSLASAVMARHDEAKETIVFAYPKGDDAPSPAKRGAAKRTPARKTPAGKAPAGRRKF